MKKSTTITETPFNTYEKHEKLHREARKTQKHSLDFQLFVLLYCWYKTKFEQKKSKIYVMTVPETLKLHIAANFFAFKKQMK